MRCLSGPRGLRLCGLDHGKLGAIWNGRTFRGKDLRQRTLKRRLNLGVDLVGHDLHDRLVLRYVLTDPLDPSADRRERGFAGTACDESAGA